MGLIFSIEPFSWASIGAAILCGVIVGIERQVRGKPAGIRTSSLIVLGTYLFVAIASLSATQSTDPSRIIGQVVTGIGFLGAGVMLAKKGMVIGVTSAAVIWALAALGVCIAIIGELVAIKLAIVIVLILHGVDVVEMNFESLTKGIHAKYANWRQPKP